MLRVAKSQVDEGRVWDVWNPELVGEDMLEYKAKDYAMELMEQGYKDVAVSEITDVVFEEDDEDDEDEYLSAFDLRRKFYHHEDKMSISCTQNFYEFDEESREWKLVDSEKFNTWW